jgi:MraZ protein
VEDCKVDGQGRVKLSQLLIDYAGIEKETVTVGNIDNILIWSKERYDEARNPLNKDIGALVADMMKYV